ncbi:MAG: prenyltransferase [Deltaproteobacteria bacterium]|nr:prenyltransferase [Deltaproteobacteria bacterium]
MSVISNWLEAFQTQNLREEVEMDVVSKWLIITRASVFPMTFFAAAIGGLLAIGTPGVTVDAPLWALCTLGLLIAHAVNNLVNDYFDTASGVDTPDYHRAKYSLHPLLSGLISKRGLVTAIVVLNLVDVAIGGVLFWSRGWVAAAYAIAGFAISIFYVAPPLRLKHHGLGEPSVFIVWGPLMIAGTYFVTTGENPAWVWGASLPYGLLVMAVLFGKHIDKFHADTEKGIRTLPVILGHETARRVTQAMIWGFYVVMVGLVAMGVLGVWTLAVLLSIPTARKVTATFAAPPPSEAPKNFPVWPLWYVAWAFGLTRRAGALFAGGLIVNAFFPFYL